MSSATTRLESVAIREVALGENPRQKVEPGDRAFEELVSSIAQHGVITPVLLGPPIEGTTMHPLIAGNRRVAAAAAAGLEEVPAMIVDRPGAEFILAVTENVQREDLSAVEEAEALDRLRHAPFNMKQAEAAQALGKSERWARDRLRLLKLPPDARQAMNERLIPLEAAVHLERVAKGSPRAVEALVAMVREDPELGRDLVNTGTVANRLRRVAAKAGLQAVDSDAYYSPGNRLEALPISDEARKRLGSLLEDVPSDPFTGKPAAFRFDEEDADAARAYGCLLEIEHEQYGVKDVDRYIADPDWLADRAEQKIPAMKAEIEARRKEHEGRDGRRKKSEEARAKELEAAERKAAKAHKSNASLAEALLAMKAPKLDLPAAKLLAAICLEFVVEVDQRLEETLGRVDARFRCEDEEGAERPAGDLLLREIAEAKTPAAVFRAVFRLIAYEELALATSPYVPKSIGKMGAGTHGEERLDAAGLDVQELSAQIAEGMGVLPDPIARALKARRAEKAEAAKKREAIANA